MLRRSTFLALAAAAPLAAFALPATAGAATVGYTSSAATLLKNGTKVAVMQGPHTATVAATLCTAGLAYVAAHGSAPVSGRYTASGLGILRSGSRIGWATNAATALDTVNLLNFGEAPKPVVSVPGVPTGVTVVGGAGRATISFTPPQSGGAVTMYTVTATKA